MIPHLDEILLRLSWPFMHTFPSRVLLDNYPRTNFSHRAWRLRPKASIPGPSRSDSCRSCRLPQKSLALRINILLPRPVPNDLYAAIWNTRVHSSHQPSTLTRLSSTFSGPSWLFEWKSGLFRLCAPEPSSLKNDGPEPCTGVAKLRGLGRMLLSLPRKFQSG
jgi:hypothetical protein